MAISLLCAPPRGHGRTNIACGTVYGGRSLDLRWVGFSDEQQRALQGILDRIDRLAEQVESALWPLVSGIDWTAHMRYRTLAPSVFATFRKPINVTHTQEDYSDDEAKALFQYTLEQILRLQDMGALVIPLPEELSQV
jgi:hypothetical protein